MTEAENNILIDGILDNLDTLGYEGRLLEDGELQQVLEGGLQSLQFVELVCGLCAELKTSLDLQEASVTQPQTTEDHEAFHLELRGFLNELKFTQMELVEDLSFLSNFRNRVLVLDFLTSELMAARLLLLKKSREQAMETSDTECGGVAACLSAIMKLYGFNKPPATVTVKQIFDRIIGKTRTQLSSLPEDQLGRSMVSQRLSQDQWHTLDQINVALTQEYAVRRQMLLTRADVTVQSLGWSEKVKGRQDEFSRVYRERRQGLQVSAPVDMARVLAAKNDLLTICKTSNLSERRDTRSDINKAVIIGKVPDRGGRPRETRPPPEMPSFKKRTAAPQDQHSQRGGASGGRGRGGKKGGRVQGGWNKGGERGGGGWGHQGSYDGHQGYQSGGKQKQYYS